MPMPVPSPSASPEEETIVPTFETQKLARTFMLDIPAPRGQITDHNGVPLAQNRLSYNLVITFPTPLNFSDAQALSYTREKIDEAGKLIGRRFRISDEAILRHYRNRGIMPFEIAPNLTPQEYEGIKDKLPPGMMVRPVYVRFYYRTEKITTGGLWALPERRAGIRTALSITTKQSGRKRRDARTGTDVQRDADREERRIQTDLRQGRPKTSEKLITPPEPGYNVVTTLDLHLQELAEKALAAKAKRGAMVIVDPNSGDVLALASWPTSHNPNALPFRPFQLINSKRCSRTRTFRFCRVHIGRPIRRDRHSKWPWASRRWKAMPSTRRININACLPIRSATAHLSRLEKKRSRRAKLRAGTHGIVRHMVLSGRHKDRFGADH